MTKLYAPQVERYAHRLGRFNYMGADRNTAYDAETYRLLDQLFQKLDLIEQRPDSDGIWDLWLRADRGPIEAFGIFQEMLEDEEVSSYEEYVRLWRESYPAEHAGITSLQYDALTRVPGGISLPPPGDKPVFHRSRGIPFGYPRICAVASGCRG